jgi:hypothetical protein
MSVRYTPRIAAAAGCSTEFSGQNAAEVVEKIMRSSTIRDKLGLNALAGEILHGLKLGKAQPAERGLTRTLNVCWQAMQTVPQAEKGIQNPLRKSTILLEYGQDDMPDVEWEWLKAHEEKFEPVKI